MLISYAYLRSNRLNTYYLLINPNFLRFISEDGSGGSSQPLAQSLLNAVCDLLFCPEFTVAPNKNHARDEADDLQTLDSCEFIWAAGVGFASKPQDSQQYDMNRKELLR